MLVWGIFGSAIQIQVHFLTVTCAAYTMVNGWQFYFMESIDIPKNIRNAEKKAYRVIGSVVAYIFFKDI